VQLGLTLRIVHLVAHLLDLKLQCFVFFLLLLQTVC